MPSVLVADDEPDLLDLVAWKLVGAGYTVHTARDGGTALHLATAIVPDLALLDVVMPVRSGLEVCRALRAAPRTADLPVLLLSALADEDDIGAGLAAGADGYVTKPFSPRALARAVDRLVRRRRARLAATAARAAATAALGVTAVPLDPADPAPAPAAIAGPGAA